MSARTARAAVACSLLLLAACGSLEPPAASVDGVGISNARVAEEVHLYTALSSIAHQPCSTPTSKETETSACARYVLGTLIQQIVIDRYAHIHGVSTTPAAVSREAGALEGQLGGGATVAKALASVGVSQATFRDLARRIVVVSSVERSIAAEKVGDAQILARYRTDIAQYTTIHAEHILLKTRAEAENVYRRVTQPGSTEHDFLNLAKRVSIDPSAQQNSGDLGSVPESSFDSVFAKAALALRPGEISQPVHTRFGWHVIRLVSASTTPFRNVRQQIAQKLGQDLFSSWLDSQLHAAEIRVNPRYGGWDETRGVVPITSTATRSIAPSSSSPTPSP